MQGLSCLDLTHPDDIQMALDYLGAICAGEISSCSFEKRFIHKKGNIVWTNLTLSPLPDPSGKIHHLIASVEDITLRKQTEESLQTSERQLKAFLNNIPDIAWLKDKDQRYIAVNEAFSLAFGIKSEDVVGKNDFEICPPYIAEKYRHDTLDVMRSGKRKSFETNLVDAEDNIIWFESIKNPIYDSQGQLIGTAGIARDITERKKAEQMKDEFLAIASHELRTPLTSLRGALGLLATGQLCTLTEQGKKMLNFALLDTERLVRLVKNLLDLQSLKFSKNAINSRNCETAELVDKVINTIQPIAEEAGINLSVTMVTGTIWADCDRILQVLTNLLENAIKFSPPQTTICLSAQQHENQILFKVQDRGRGIPSDKIESIFAPFEQVDVSDSRAYGGTGLGLAICRSIVEQHQGHIWVESTLGIGSTFCFTLPLGNRK